MTHNAQRFVLAALGLVVLRAVTTGTYLNYVKPGMRPLLLISGLVLIGLAIADALRRRPDPHDQPHEQPHHAAPAMAWLLLLPVACLVLLAPPPLGAFSAERSVDVSAADLRPDQDTGMGFDPLPAEPAATLTLTEYSFRALWDDNHTLAGRTVKLTGFATEGTGGTWYLTRMTIQCCAADAAAVRVAVRNAPAPPADQWVEVIGTWDPQGTTSDAEDTDQERDQETDEEGRTAQIRAQQVNPVPPPREPYE